MKTDPDMSRPGSNPGLCGYSYDSSPITFAHVKIDPSLDPDLFRKLSLSWGSLLAQKMTPPPPEGKDQYEGLT